MSYYVVMTSTAQVKGKARQFGRYRNIAVVEIEDGHELPKMISERARGVVRIARHYGACSVGKTERCEYRRYMAEAEALAENLNHHQEEIEQR